MSSAAMTLSGELVSQPLSAAGFPVNLTALQENVRHLLMTVISQESLKESFARLNPDGSLLRMSRGYAQANLEGFLENSYMIFPKWGIVSDGVAGELSMLEPVTDGSGSLLLPTVMANNLECEGKEFVGTRHALKLHQALNMLPPLRANERGGYQRDRGEKGKERPTLTGAIRILPTCTSRDHKGGTVERIEEGNPKRALDCEMQVHGLKLQPVFAEWMMGFPEGWTALDASEMPSSRSKSTQSSKRLQKLKAEA